MSFPAICLTACLAAMLALGGCAEPGQPGPLSSSGTPLSRIDAWLKTDIDTLVLYGAGLRQASPAELTAEAEAVNKAYAAHPNETNRLRLAVFLALAPNAYSDRGRALTLLDVPANDANGRGRTQPIAAFLIPLLQDVRRLDDTQQKLRDEQKRGDALQQKLDAIRDIEKNMLERAPTKTP